MTDFISISNNFFSTILGSIGYRPQWIRPLFPPYVVPLEKIEDLIAAKQFPSLEGFADAITYFLILNVVRYVLQNYIIKSVAARLMKLKLVDFRKNSFIDDVLPWKPKKIYTNEDFKVLKDYSTEDLRQYLWERKRHMINHQKIVKFVEAFWRAIFYTGFSVLGYYALFVPKTAVWFWDNEHHFKDWPYHELTPALQLYYTIELGCYFHQLLWTEVTRSDAAEMITHHIVTILLIVISYLTGLFRIGASILFLHDLADIFLETAKVFNYISGPPENKWMKSAIVDPLFAVFATVFFVTRLVIYPKNILLSLFNHGYPTMTCEWAGCPIYVGLLFSLQCLHIFWFFLILRMVYKLMMGTMKGDERSDDEEELEENDNIRQEAETRSSNSKKKRKTKKNA